MIYLKSQYLQHLRKYIYCNYLNMIENFAMILNVGTYKVSQN